MAKATSYSFQGREWTVKDLAEELGLSTDRVYRLLKDHNEDIKAIFESRGITPKPADKGPKARLFDYKGKQWTVKQLAEEFGLSNVRVNRLIKEFDGDIEKIASSREKSKKTVQTEKIPKEELEIKLHLDDEVFVVKEKSSEQLLDTMKNYIKKIHQEDKNLSAAEGFLIYIDLNEENHRLGIELINEDSAEFNYTFDIYSADFHKFINDKIGKVGDYVVANDDSAIINIFDRILGHKKIISIKNEVILGIRHPNFNNIEEEEYTEIAIDYDDPLNSILNSQNWDSLSRLRPDSVMSSLQFGFKDSVENTVTCYDFDLEEELDYFDEEIFANLIFSKDIDPTLLGVERSCGSTITEIAKSKFIFEWEK